jgi:hypothetical protein
MPRLWHSARRGGLRRAGSNEPGWEELTWRDRSGDREGQVRSGLSPGGRWIRTSGSWSRDRQTVMGEVTAFSKPGADLLGNRRFESSSLQQRVCEPSVPRRPSQPRSANAGQAHNRLGKDPARRVLHWSRISKSARPTSRHPNISAGYARRYWVRTTRQGARSASYRLW